MKTRNLLKVPSKWDRKRRNFKWNLIPNRLIELAKSGEYYESKVLHI